MEVHYRRQPLNRRKFGLSAGFFCLSLLALFIFLQKDSDVANMETSRPDTDPNPEIVFVPQAEKEEEETTFYFDSAGPVLADIMPSYTGERLGGGEFAPVLEFSEEDYERALASNALILLTFSGNWCDACIYEQSQAIIPAFSTLAEKNVVAFHVNLNDNQTSAKENALAQEFGVTEQNTKVFVKNGHSTLTTTETWLSGTYTSTIQSLLTE